MDGLHDYQDVVAWRHHIHAHPELGFEVEATADFIHARLQEFGCDEIVRGIGRTGIVAVINGKRSGNRTIGLRSEMDALPILELGKMPWVSTVKGRMHACGHDGHAAMLLGAARDLANDRDFAGRVAIIFQPAEEKGGGGREMVRDGFMQRFSIDAVYGLHNRPGVDVGKFVTRPGPLLAETAEFDIVVKGKSGHAAQPHNSVDPIVIAAQITLSLQTIVARRMDPIHSVVVSITRIQGGDAYNVIPDTATLRGTIRSLCEMDTALAKELLVSIAEGTASMQGAEAVVSFIEGYPVTFNDEGKTQLCASAAAVVSGHESVKTDIEPVLGAEDFSFMLKQAPGAMMFIGNGDTAHLHNAHYDFNDAVIPFGIRYWKEIVRAELGAPNA